MAPYVPTPALVTSRDTAGNQTTNDITALASGGYVVTWTDTPASGAASVRARVYDANGRPASAEITVGLGGFGSVTALTNGGFAVAVAQQYTDTNAAANVSVRLFDATGTAQADPIVLDRQPSGSNQQFGLPEATTLSDGRLLIAWRRSEDLGNQRIVGTIIDQSGAVLTSLLPLGQASTSYGFTDFAIAAQKEGGFTVISEDQTGFISNIILVRSFGNTNVQSFGSNGQPVSGVSIIKDGIVTPVSAAALPDGRAVIGYHTEIGANAGKFVIRLVSQDGTISAERALRSAGYSSSISTTQDGNILFSYTNVVPTSQSPFVYSSYNQELFSPDGASLGLVSNSNPASSTNFDGVLSQVAAALPDGSIALGQTTRFGPFGNQYDVITRVYQPAAVTSDPDGSPLVNDAYYNARYPDVAAAGVDPDFHYDTIGWKEGRDPNALFSTEAYRSANPDVAAADVNPLAHYDTAGWKEGRDPSAAFDNEIYLARNPDVKAAGLDPLLHYLQYGRAEGREIAPAIGSPASIIHGGFDAEYYLLSNPDVGRYARASGSRTVAEAAEVAYQHYETYGWREGRNPNAYFDVAAYLTGYADVKAANIDPLLHYDAAGWKEGRDPSGRFDTSNYLGANADVRAANVDPLVHFLTNGALEGRPPLGDGTFD